MVAAGNNVKVKWHDGVWYDAKVGDGVLVYSIDRSYELSRIYKKKLQTWQDGEWMPVTWKKNEESANRPKPFLWARLPGEKTFQKAVFDGENLKTKNSTVQVVWSESKGFEVPDSSRSIYAGRIVPFVVATGRPTVWTDKIIRSEPKKTRKPIDLEETVREYTVRYEGGQIQLYDAATNEHDAKASRRCMKWVKLCHGVLSKHTHDSVTLTNTFFARSQRAFEILEEKGGKSHCFALVADGYGGHQTLEEFRKDGKLSQVIDQSVPSGAELAELVLICSDTTGNRCGSRILAHIIEDFIGPNRVLVADAVVTALPFYKKHGFRTDARASNLVNDTDPSQGVVQDNLMRVYYYSNDDKPPPSQQKGGSPMESTLSCLMSLPGYLFLTAILTARKAYASVR